MYVRVDLQTVCPELIKYSVGKETDRFAFAAFNHVNWIFFSTFQQLLSRFLENLIIGDDTGLTLNLSFIESA